MIWGNRVLTRGRCSTKIYGSPAHITAGFYWCNHRWSLIYLTTSRLFCPTLFGLDYILQLALTSHNFRIQWTAWAVSQYAQCTHEYWHYFSRAKCVARFWSKPWSKCPSRNAMAETAAGLSPLDQWEQALKPRIVMREGCYTGKVHALE